MSEVLSALLWPQHSASGAMAARAVSIAGLTGDWLGPLKTQILDQQGSVVSLQPKRAQGVKVSTLMMDLKTGEGPDTAWKQCFSLDFSI
jgi:hypothetical protein